RCPPELLEAIDALGVQRYPSDNDNGCDRTKTLLDTAAPLAGLSLQAVREGIGSSKAYSPYVSQTL
ncbi:MAG: hypothetical protein AAFY21_21740, partial [Cyanobacteria bacterium J06641_2]